MKYIAYAEVKKAVSMETVLARCGHDHGGPCDSQPHRHRAGPGDAGEPVLTITLPHED